MAIDLPIGENVTVPPANVKRLKVNADGTAALLDTDGTEAPLGGSVADGSITNAKLADVATGTVKGRTAGGSGVPSDLTDPSVTSIQVAASSAAAPAVKVGSGAGVYQSSGFANTMGLSVGGTELIALTGVVVIFPQAIVAFDAAQTYKILPASNDLKLIAPGDIQIGETNALATNATVGFLNVPSCAGTPTGTPTPNSGKVPLVVDTTNNKLYGYYGAAWHDLTGA